MQMLNTAQIGLALPVSTSYDSWNKKIHRENKAQQLDRSFQSGSLNILSHVSCRWATTSGKHKRADKIDKVKQGVISKIFDMNIIPQKSTPWQMHRRYQKNKETHKTCAIVSHGELWVSNQKLKLCLGAAENDSYYGELTGSWRPNVGADMEEMVRFHAEAHQVWRNHQETHPIHPGEVMCFVSVCFTCFPSDSIPATHEVMKQTTWEKEKPSETENQFGKDHISQSDDFSV